jgi:hypothetical protein
MGRTKPPKPVKLIVSAFAPGDALLQEARAALTSRWGATDYESELLPFAHTTYYAAEFGAGLVRRIWSFESLVDPAALAQIKRETNDLEQRWLREARRQVNLDPGYVSMAKLVLATTKNHGHRIYLDDGIYAEVTLQYRDGAFRAWPWTYPDYASPRYCAFFEDIRRRYVTQLRQSTRE